MDYLDSDKSKGYQAFSLIRFRLTIGKMVTSWFQLLLGVAFVQDIVSFSPVPIPEEEWGDFMKTLRDPAYRLPTTTVPSSYELSLTPYFEEIAATETGTPFTFDGEVVINIAATVANVNEIVMHCNDLTLFSVAVEYTLNSVTEDIAANQTYQCEMPYAFLRIPTSESLVLGRNYVVRISFRGNLQDNMRGFYRSWYYDSTGKRWMGTTQFQPGHARQAFPCYDEPGFKAYFDITINREALFSPSISNMPILSTSPIINGRVAETFYTTPLTSTYLLAFIVSHYEVVATNNDTVRPFDIYARNNAGTTGQWSLEVGEALLAAMDNYTQLPYYNMAPNMNMKQAAIPDFSAGAMENWGLLTYREALFLYDPINSNHFYRQRVANIVSHEIAHMWFGNLVTCAWWDNLWLNEGFARFYQYYLTGSVRPELGFATRFITEQVHTSMLADSIDTAHALTDTSVNDPTAVSAHFSTITYGKGAAVLRMTQHLLGEDTYVKALRNYLAARQYDVAVPQDLFTALDAAALEDGALSAYNGMTIDTYFRTWSEQAGHPLITVSVNQETGQITVTQARWERNTGSSSIASLWAIPITWTRAGAPDFEDLKPQTFMTTQAASFQRGTTELEWVLFNKQQTGFYRVNYDATNWALLTRTLRSSNRTVIHEYNRAQIVDDVFVLARAGVMSYRRALNILSFLEFEDSYAPWMAAITGFNFVIRRLAHDNDNLQKLQDEIIRLSAAVTNRLGFVEIDGEPYMDGLLRMYVMNFLCNNGHPECVSTAQQYFQNWLNVSFVPANMRPWVYCNGLRQGSEDDYDYFWNHYLDTDLATENVVKLEAAGCTTNQASLWKYLNSIVAGDEQIRAQDFTVALNSAVTGNEANTMRVFEWLRNNVNQTISTLGSAATPISYIAARLLNEEQIVEFETWIQANQAILGAAYTTGINGAASVRTQLAWSENRIPELAEYFEAGYEDELEVEEETETETPVIDSTTAPTTTEDPGSANIAALSFITLIVSVAINFAA